MRRIGLEGAGQALPLPWIAVIAFVILGPTNRSVFAPMKWGDFAHFYSLGYAARARDTAVLYDSRELHALQARLIPESSKDGFLSVYAPPTALLFAPFSMLSYFAGGLAWSAVTMAVYLIAVWLAWRPAREVLPDRAFVFAAALASPPVWQLAIWGQTTVVPLLAFLIAWIAFERNRPFVAGLAFSLLTIKPQWGLVPALVMLACGEWRVVLGAISGVGLQAAAVLTVFDRSVFPAYANVVRRLPSLSPLLEPDAYKMHSLRALTALLPSAIDWTAWSVLSLAIVGMTALNWRRSTDWRLRMGVLVLAALLVNPHVTIYEVTLLTLPAIWIGGWLLQHRPPATWYWQLLFWIAVALLIPTRRFMPIQTSVILMGVLFVRVVRELLVQLPADVPAC